MSRVEMKINIDALLKIKVRLRSRVALIDYKNKNLIAISC